MTRPRGTGYIRERPPKSGRWEVSAYSHVDGRGVRHTKTRVVHGTRTDAQRRLSALQAEIQERRNPAAAGTVADLLARYLAHAEPDLELTTMRGYRQCAARIVKDLGPLPLERLTPARIDRFYRDLLGENIGRKKDKPRYRTPATVQRHHAVLRRALNQAARWGEIDTNPAALAVPPRAHRKEIRIPTPELAERLMAEAFRRDENLGSAAYLGLATGMRRGELCGLRWDDIDLEAGRLTLRHAVVDVGGKVHDKDPKSHRVRVVELDPQTVEVLRRHKDKAAETAKRSRRKLRPSGYVWASDASGRQPRRPDWLTKAWGRVCKALGADGVTLHGLRHLMATTWLDAGVPVPVVSRRLGHASVSTTLDIYAHSLDGAQKEAAAKMGARLPALPERTEER